MWVYNIKTDLRRDKMEWYGLYRSGLGYGSVEGSCHRNNEHLSSVKYGEFLDVCTTGSFSRNAQFLEVV
jgi:hypothetical protein